jgi:hypothetical protein
MLDVRKICAVDVMKVYFGAFLAFQERKPGDEARSFFSSDFHLYPPQHFCMRKNMDEHGVSLEMTILNYVVY